MVVLGPSLSSLCDSYIGFQAMLLMRLHLPLENFFYVNILVIKHVFDNTKH